MRKLTLKPIITAILVATMLITSINTGCVTTVNAATSNYMEFKSDENIVMKPRDVKKIQFIIHDKDNNAHNWTYMCNWTSSDESVVSVEFVHFYSRETDYIELTANNPGTATITGTSNNNKPLNMTVTVKAPKMTAKQKKCKHKYKVTKEASCMREGVKTCKKCKWQKTTKKTKHMWATSTETEYVYTETHIEAFCMGCNCPEVPEGEIGDNWHYQPGTQRPKCTSPCTKKWTTEEYDSYDAMMKAIMEHLQTSECNNYTPNKIQMRDYMGGPMEKVTKTVTKCFDCGKTKE